MIFLILAGVAFMITGISLLYALPFITTDAEFPGEFYFDDGKNGNLQMNFHAPSGLMPARAVTDTISVTFHETKVNSSQVEMDFPNAVVGDDPKDISPTASEGKIVTLSFDKNDSKISTYIAKPSLTYHYANQFAATLKIKSGNHTINKEFGDVISIGSWDSFWSNQQGNQTLGLTFMIIGVGVIGSAPTFAKLADLRIKRTNLKDMF